MEADWHRLIRDALEPEIQRTGAAVSGAKLRTLVARLARDSGVEFPPPGMRTFSSFLESFAADFIVQRRPGSDILVTLAEKPEALAAASASEPGDAAARLRQDLFQALTRIPAEGARRSYYVPHADEIRWAADEELDPTWIPFPVTSIEGEINVRRTFAEKQEQAAQAELLSALDSATPLRDFTARLHDTGLVFAWHQYRLKDLIGRLKSWAEQRGIEWKPNWVELPDARPSGSLERASVTQHLDLRDLQRFVSLLSDRDIVRIHVPLDIVLKLIHKS